MDEGIFSTYRQGENRVTASLLAVLRSLVLPRIEFILGALLGDEINLVSFHNQPSKGAAGVPDAEIKAKAHVLLETKTKRNDVKREQLERHLKQLGIDADARVLVLTPDDYEPKEISEINDKRLVWTSFVNLNAAINDLLEIEKEVVSEREEFLLRELQKMLDADGLLQPDKEVVVVAARPGAWPMYQRFHSYICQPNRAFRNVKYLAFYSEGQIQATVPTILSARPEPVVFRSGLYDGPTGELVKRILDAGEREEGATNKVFLLSTPDDTHQTIKLEQPVKNDLPFAFVQGQRYVSLAALRIAKRTSELIEQSE